MAHATTGSRPSQVIKYFVSGSMDNSRRVVTHHLMPGVSVELVHGLNITDNFIEADKIIVLVDQSNPDVESILLRRLLPRIADVSKPIYIAPYCIIGRSAYLSIEEISSIVETSMGMGSSCEIFYPITDADSVANISSSRKFVDELRDISNIQDLGSTGFSGFTNTEIFPRAYMVAVANQAPSSFRVRRSQPSVMSADFSRSERPELQIPPSELSELIDLPFKQPSFLRRMFSGGFKLPSFLRRMFSGGFKLPEEPPLLEELSEDDFTRAQRLMHDNPRKAERLIPELMSYNNGSGLRDYPSLVSPPEAAPIFQSRDDARLTAFALRGRADVSVAATVSGAGALTVDSGVGRAALIASSSFSTSLDSPLGMPITRDVLVVTPALSPASISSEVSRRDDSPVASPAPVALPAPVASPTSASTALKVIAGVITAVAVTAAVVGAVALVAHGVVPAAAVLPKLLTAISVIHASIAATLVAAGTFCAALGGLALGLMCRSGSHNKAPVAAGASSSALTFSAASASAGNDGPLIFASRC